MVQVLPFHGLRYAPGLAGPAVVAPPYDVIDPAAHRALLGRSPHNVVRLILGDADAGPGWHADAADTLRAWERAGVLVRDARPHLYGYRQTFRAPDGTARTRTGLVARVRLEPWGHGIHRHEQTRRGPRADRLRLMRAVDANLSPVFGLYRDPAGDLARWLRPPERPAVNALVDGVGEAFWPITDAVAERVLIDALAERDVVIADGHHRYETALAYRDLRNEDPSGSALNGPRPWDYVMMVLVAVEDPGLLVLPTHRVVARAAVPEASTLLAALQADFSVQPVDRGTLGAAAAAAGRDGVALGLCLDGAGRYLLRLKDPAAARRAAPAGQEPVADLDVSVLQNLILAPHLGISAEALSGGDAVGYTIDEKEACDAVQAGQAGAAFILNPTDVEQVWSVAVAGATMPPKSTYFSPKLLTGLVIHPLGEGNTPEQR